MSRRLLWSLVGLTVLPALCLAKLPAKPRFAPGDPNSKLTSVLRQTLSRLDETARTQGVPSARIARRFENPLIQVSADGEFRVYLTVTDCTPTTQADLAARGARIAYVAEDLNLIEAWVLSDRLREVAASSSIRRIAAVMRGHSDADTVVTEGDAILGADQLRSYGLSGSGVKVGVISDDVDHLADAQQAGELPAVTVLNRHYLELVNEDEGTAMLEIVHDIAPGASLYFYAAGDLSSLEMRDAIRALADAGCRVIVDDWAFADQPFFEDGPLAKVVDEVAQRGVTYCASAGNYADKHYQGEYVPANGVRGFHAWNSVSDSAMNVLVEPRGVVTIVLQWNDPFTASGNNYDLYLCDDDALTQPVAHSDDEQNDDHLYPPLEAVTYENTSGSVEWLFLGVKLVSGEPRDISVFLFPKKQPLPCCIEYGGPEGSVFGHHAARGAITVGTINADDSGLDSPAEYSSQGPLHIWFPTEETRMKPDVMGIDHVSVSGAGGFNVPFNGTSAAAPHIAGVAALLLDSLAHPDWTPADIRQALTSSAKHLGDPVPNNTFGYGLVQALPAVGKTLVKGYVGTPSCPSRWVKAKSPYHVTGFIWVPQGQTLTIEPGVDVLIDTEMQFTVEGRLQAVGTVSGNIRFMRGRAASWGGIRIIGGDSSTIAYAQITGGLAHGDSPHDRGGAIYVQGAGTKLSLSRAVMYGNSAALGGGVACADGALVTLTNCTMSGNVASAQGGGLFARTGATARLVNCILWGDSPSEISNDSQYLGTIAAMYSDVQGGYAGAGNINTDPLFVNVLAHDYRLQSGSPCIDAGDANSPLDPDGTRADMGGLLFHHVAPPTTQVQILAAADGAAGDQFGASVSVCGSYAVVGVPRKSVGSKLEQGSAYVFERGGDDVWRATAVLYASDGAAGDYFGCSVSLDGSYAVIGAEYDDVGSNQKQGSAYVFERGSDGVWRETAVLYASDGAADDYFGRSVSLSGSHVLVATLGSGSAYVFERGGDGMWQETAVLRACDGAANDLFGFSVSLSGSYAVIGAKSDSVGSNYAQGSAYVFELGADGVWRQTAVLTASDGAARDAFGQSVSVNGSRAVVAAEGNDVGSNQDQGSTYVFERGNDGMWRETAVLTASNGAAGDWFGYSVSLNASYALVGSRFKQVGSNSNQGSAYVFEQSGDGIWREMAILTASDGASVWWFGYSVSLSGSYAFVGAPRQSVGSVADQGSAYVFAIQTPSTALVDFRHAVPLALSQNVPNPFNPSTTIRFSLRSSGPAHLAIYDVNGRLVRTLVDRPLAAGQHEVVWNGADAAGRRVASGVYLYRLTSGEGRVTKRMVLLR